ncbi:hypothetical protein B5X24_HaOG200997, partial [Helicoverpa armigera]
MSEKRKIVPYPSPMLPNTEIDKEMQGIVKSFNFVLHLFFSSKYCLRRNNVYPRGTKYRFMTVLHTSFLNGLNVFRAYRDSSIGVTVNDFMRIMNCCYDFVQMYAFILLFILDFVHKQNHVLLILAIQTINRSFDLSKSIRSFIIWNWIVLFITLCLESYMHIVYYAIYAHSRFSDVIPDCICDFMFISFNVNYIFATRIIILLKIYLDEWVKFILILNEREENNEYCLKLLEIYENIMQAYNLAKTVFKNLISVSHTLDLFFWVTKTMLLSLVHCAYCERFYISVEEAECACIQLIKNINCPKSHKYLCKAVIRINRSFSKMTACGLFYIDASLAICFFGAVTNYAIVMLQFTF